MQVVLLWLLWRSSGRTHARCAWFLSSQGSTHPQRLLHWAQRGEEFDQSSDLLCQCPLVWGEDNFPMTACKLKFHPLKSKLVFFQIVLLPQYSIPGNTVSGKVYQNVLRSAVRVISNKLVASGGASCLGSGSHRHFMACSAFSCHLFGGYVCLKSLKPGEKSWKQGWSTKLYSACKVPLVLYGAVARNCYKTAREF